MIVDSVFNRDYAVVQGVVLIVAIGFLMLNLLADVLYAVLISENARLTMAELTTQIPLRLRCRAL